MALKIALVDDLETDRLELERSLLTWSQGGPGISLSSFAAGVELLEQYALLRPQIVFLDVYMEGMNGIELARRLRELDPALLIVFLTSSREHAFDAFPVHPFDYLLKPCDPAHVARVMNEALRALGQEERELTIRIPRGECRVRPGSIVSAVAQGHNVELALANGRALRSITPFGELELALAEDERFLLCNRGVLVNMDHAASLDGGLIRMSNGACFALRTKGRAELVTRFSQYQISRMKRWLR